MKKIKILVFAGLIFTACLAFNIRAYAQSASRQVTISVEVVPLEETVPAPGGTSEENEPTIEKIINGITDIINTITNNPEETPSLLRTALTYIGIKKEQSSPTSLAITTLATAAILPAASLINASTLFSFSEYLKMIWLQLLSLFGVKKKKGKSWGKITESNSDMPIPQAKIDLFTLAPEGGKKLYATTYTDRTGSYGFIAEPGKYVIEVTKGDYKLMTPESNRTIEIKTEKEGFVSPQIVMAMGEDKLKKKLRIINTINYLEKVLRMVSILFIIIGTILALDDLFQGKDFKGFIVAGTYILMWLLVWNISTRKSPWGSVSEQTSAKPISLALVRIMDKKDSKKLVQTSISNQSGKFSAVVKKGDYKVVVAKPEYELIRPHFFSTRKNVGALNLDIVLKHHAWSKSY
ncbi:MAG: carboxypeptidase-like regulatory domain-containing protein [Patescibacteria group bacterium]